MIDKLRDEIVESEKVRTDMLKWKLIVVAALGAASLGLGSTSSGNTGYLLALIPFVCLYVDAICFHNTLRILAIAAFLRGQKHPSSEAREYEKFCATNRKFFSLEDVALLATTLLLSALVVFVAGSDKCQQLIGVVGRPLFPDLWFYSGAVGCVAGALCFIFYKVRTWQLDKLDPVPRKK